MSKRILVVEDQPDNRQIIRDMLAPTDYEITEAENGEEALAAIANQRPDLILMDIQLPIMDGYTATSQIKADPALRSIPIIAVTSYALSGEEKKARAAGCDDYVPKPFSPRQLLAKIRPSCSARGRGGLRRISPSCRITSCLTIPTLTL
jgi:two-component system cell cycle response regulator DivK